MGTSILYVRIGCSQFLISVGVRMSPALPSSSPVASGFCFAAQGLLADLGAITQYGDMIHPLSNSAVVKPTSYRTGPLGKVSILPGDIQGQ